MKLDGKKLSEAVALGIAAEDASNGNVLAGRSYCPIHGSGLRIGPLTVDLGNGVGWTTKASCTCGNRGLIGTAISAGKIERHPKERASANVKS